MIPEVFSWAGVMGTPFSIVLEISKTARDMEITEKSEASARCMPGQIRLPYPKQTFLGSRWASFSGVEMYLAGSKVNGSG